MRCAVFKCCQLHLDCIRTLADEFSGIERVLLNNAVRLAAHDDDVVGNDDDDVGDVGDGIGIVCRFMFN